MEIELYKERSVDFNKSVTVYRCLNRRGNVYSIKQGSLVVAHTTNLTLRDITFHVDESGRQRCIKKKQRNVHAWAIGYINDTFIKCYREIFYNPYKNESFVLKNEKSHIDKAKLLSICDNSIFIN